MLWVPFSSPLIVASPFFGVLDWSPEDEAAVALAACCWANLSRKACCRVCTTSGMTASMSDRDSIGRPSNTVPSCHEKRQSVSTKASRCKREALACTLSPHWCWSRPPHTGALSAGWRWGQQGALVFHWCWTGWCGSLCQRWTLSVRNLRHKTPLSSLTTEYKLKDAQTGHKYSSGQPTNAITTTESLTVVTSVLINDIQSASMRTS